MLDQIFGRLFFEPVDRNRFIQAGDERCASIRSGTRHSVLERFVFPVLIAIVIGIITDIDTPRVGFVSLHERPLLDLNETLSRSSATTTP